MVRFVDGIQEAAIADNRDGLQDGRRFARAAVPGNKVGSPGHFFANIASQVREKREVGVGFNEGGFARKRPATCILPRLPFI